MKRDRDFSGGLLSGEFSTATLVMKERLVSERGAYETKADHIQFPPMRGLGAYGNDFRISQPAFSPGLGGSEEGVQTRKRAFAEGSFCWIKRALDIVVSAIGLLLCLPLLVMIALAIKLDSGGPVFFVQKRPGCDGRRFRIFKFRTMRPGAMNQFRKLSPEQREQFARHGKVHGDPRVTRVGQWLRRFSLDELPQLWNVLRGDMSLVGPRPYLKSQLGGMADYQEIIFRVRPGLTGLWQINGRNEVSFQQRLGMDAFYVSKFSLRLDLSILLDTPWALISGKGAY
jgi:lipopolysaccharide/colanic/teichoic acid biosynthesis glycosyltransferase